MLLIFLLNFKYLLNIGVAPITQYTHVCYKNSNTQGRSPNMVNVTFHLKGKNSLPLGENSLREVPILKRDIIVENHCLIQ